MYCCAGTPVFCARVGPGGSCKNLTKCVGSKSNDQDGKKSWDATRNNSLKEIGCQLLSIYDTSLELCGRTTLRSGKRAAGIRSLSTCTVPAEARLGSNKSLRLLNRGGKQDCQGYNRYFHNALAVVHCITSQ